MPTITRGEEATLAFIATAEINRRPCQAAALAHDARVTRLNGLGLIETVAGGLRVTVTGWRSLDRRPRDADQP